MDYPKILMGAENPNGWKLESLLEKIEQEVEAKSEKIMESTHPMRDSILKNNYEICGLLAQARALQVDTYENLGIVSKDEGPLHPRL